MTDILNSTPIPPVRSYLVDVDEAAKITGLPKSLLRKTFMREGKRPKNVPKPPPHKRIGRSIYIVTDQLSKWVDSLNSSEHSWAADKSVN